MQDLQCGFQLYRESPENMVKNRFFAFFANSGFFAKKQVLRVRRLQEPFQEEAQRPRGEGIEGETREIGADLRKMRAFLSQQDLAGAVSGEKGTQGENPQESGSEIHADH